MVDDITPHIIGITESWANNDVTDAELGLEGYSGRFRGGAGGPGPLWESQTKNVKGSINGKFLVLLSPHWIAPAFGCPGKMLVLPPHPLNRVGFWRPRKHCATSPPPPLNRVGFWRPRKNYATTPPPLPTESRRPGTSHERGEIMDPRLGYVMFRKDRVERRGGGVLLCIKYRKKQICNEALWCNLVTGHTTVTIGVVYRCPNITIHSPLS